MKRLTWWGMLLFMFGLLTGLTLATMPNVADNPRGLLSGHLGAVMNGMFLIIVGLLADRIRLSALATSICKGLLLFAAFVSWLTTTVGAILGASKATPIAGAGHHASPAAEQVILAVAVSTSIAMICAVGMLLYGLRRTE